MAEAGFYSTGKKSEPDLAKCFICCKELDGWEEDDDPWSEHKKHASYCPFIQLGKKTSMLTIGDVLYLHKERNKALLKIHHKEKLEELEKVVKAVATDLERTGLKENDKTVGSTSRKRSSRKCR